MSVIYWRDLPDKEVVQWLVALRRQVEKMLLTKLQRRKSKKVTDVQAKDIAAFYVSRISTFLAGHSVQKINERLSLSDDVYILLFKSLWSKTADSHRGSMHEDLTAAEAYELSDVLIHEFASDEFQDYALARVDTVRRSYQRSKTTLVRQLIRLKQHYSKLMLVRVDLHYAKDYAKHAEPERRVLDDWKTLRSAIAKRFVTSQLGYFAKLEYGKDRSVHMHVLFLFNGRIVREDESIGRKICSIWVDEVTGGIGTAYNVNNPIKKAAYKNCGIGVFKDLDGATIAGFQAVANYLTKPEFLTRLAMPWQKRHIFSHFVPRNLPCSRASTSAAVPQRAVSSPSNVPLLSNIDRGN